MGRKLTPGLVRIGHLDDGGRDNDVASVELDGRGALVSCPSREGVDRGLFATDDATVPAVMHFMDHEGHLTLGECSDAGGARRFGGPAVARIRARRVVAGAPSGHTYETVDGMTSEVDGLATWAQMSTVSSRVEPPTDGRKLAVVIRAENPDNVRLGGRLDSTLITAFSHDPVPKGNVFSVTDIVSVRTRSETPIAWGEHAVVHHMVQDLMCLVYGKPCTSTLTQVKREDDQPYLNTPDDGRRLWREVYEPTFGRTSGNFGDSPDDALDRYKDQPLFYLDDVDSDKLAGWMDEWDQWSRPTWIAVTTMFQRGTTVEAQLLQLGVALEKASLATPWGPAARPSAWRLGRRRPNSFEGL